VQVREPLQYLGSLVAFVCAEQRFVKQGNEFRARRPEQLLDRHQLPR
jgi:hypothetical protein